MFRESLSYHKAGFGNRRTLTLSSGVETGVPGRPLRIVGLSGGEGVRRRLLALGFHKEDLLEVDFAGIFHGPLLVRNLASDTSVALGRGVAQRVLVEVVSDE